MGDMQGRLETPPVLLPPGSVVLPVPEMQDRHGETPILDAHTMAQQAHGEIGIFITPTGEGFVHAIEGSVVSCPDTEVTASVHAPVIGIAIPPAPQIHAEPTQRLIYILPKPSLEPLPFGPQGRSMRQGGCQQLTSDGFRQQDSIPRHTLPRLGK